MEVLGGQHAVIHPDIPRIPNNAYLVDGTHLHPGDALDTAPPGRWTCCSSRPRRRGQKLADAVDYLREVAPRTAVPIHQGVLAEPGLFYGHFERLFEQTLAPDAATPVRSDPSDPRLRGVLTNWRASVKVLAVATSLPRPVPVAVIRS